MAEYVYAKLADGSFTCAKFEGAAEPAAVYKLKWLEQGGRAGAKLSCDCPAGRWRNTPCKHVKELLNLLKKGHFDEPDQNDHNPS